MAFQFKGITFRKLYSLGKVLLPTLWVGLFIVVLYDRSLSSQGNETATGATTSTKKVSRVKNVTDKTQQTKPEISNYQVKRIQEYQVLNRMYFGSNKHYMLAMNPRPKNCMLYPDIFIVGFEKCGTMTLRTYLGSHPQIFVPKSNLSIPYFNSEKYYTSFEEYTRNMECTPPGKLRLEKISTYGLADKVYETLPNVTLLAIVREPVDRAMSHHVHRIARRKESFLDFDKLIYNILKGKDSIHTVNTSVLFRQSTYVDRLQQWLQTYGRDRIHIIDGDKFIKHPDLVLNNVERFLNITSYFTPDQFVYNPVNHFYCLKSFRGCMDASKGRPHPNMSEFTRKTLQDYFRPLNYKLFQSIGQNFSWNY